MLLFRSEEHVQRWCRQWGLPQGEILSPEQTWRLAEAWYSSDRRDPAWQRRTPAQSEALFAELGLTSSFWSLSTGTSG